MYILGIKSLGQRMKLAAKWKRTLNRGSSLYKNDCNSNLHLFLPLTFDLLPYTIDLTLPGTFFQKHLGKSEIIAIGLDKQNF